jgi:predicted DNA-binding transcriptional regulator AlpA
MKTKSEPTLRQSLCKVGYSEKTIDKFMKWYTFPEKKELDKPVESKG